MIAHRMSGTTPFAGAVVGQDMTPQARGSGSGRESIVTLAAGSPPDQIAPYTISFNVEYGVWAVVTVAAYGAM
jgi:hypothetical protein